MQRISSRFRWELLAGRFSVAIVHAAAKVCRINARSRRIQFVRQASFPNHPAGEITPGAVGKAAVRRAHVIGIARCIYGHCIAIVLIAAQDKLIYVCVARGIDFATRTCLMLQAAARRPLDAGVSLHVEYAPITSRRVPTARDSLRMRAAASRKRALSAWRPPASKTSPLRKQ
jgi:hypothetical protein